MVGETRGNKNCEAARSEAGMSRELCIVRTVRARKGARWVGVLEYRVPPVLYRGGCPLGMQLCVCILFPYPRISTKTSHEFPLMGGPKPKPPDAWWLMDNLRVYGHNCIMLQGHSAQSDLF